MFRVVSSLLLTARTVALQAAHSPDGDAGETNVSAPSTSASTPADEQSPPWAPPPPPSSPPAHVQGFPPPQRPPYPSRAPPVPPPHSAAASASAGASASASASRAAWENSPPRSVSSIVNSDRMAAEVEAARAAMLMNDPPPRREMWGVSTTDADRIRHILSTADFSEASDDRIEGQLREVLEPYGLMDQGHGINTYPATAVPPASATQAPGADSSNHPDGGSTVRLISDRPRLTAQQRQRARGMRNVERMWYLHAASDYSEYVDASDEQQAEAGGDYESVGADDLVPALEVLQTSDLGASTATPTLADAARSVSDARGPHLESTQDLHAYRTARLAAGSHLGELEDDVNSGEHENDVGGATPASRYVTPPSGRSDEQYEDATEHEDNDGDYIRTRDGTLLNAEAIERAVDRILESTREPALRVRGGQPTVDQPTGASEEINEAGRADGSSNVNTLRRLAAGRPPSRRRPLSSDPVEILRRNLEAIPSPGEPTAAAFDLRNRILDSERRLQASRGVTSSGTDMQPGSPVRILPVRSRDINDNSSGDESAPAIADPAAMAHAFVTDADLEVQRRSTQQGPRELLAMAAERAHLMRAHDIATAINAPRVGAESRIDFHERGQNDILDPHRSALQSPRGHNPMPFVTSTERASTARYTTRDSAAAERNPAAATAEADGRIATTDTDSSSEERDRVRPAEDSDPAETDAAERPLDEQFRNLHNRNPDRGPNSGSVRITREEIEEILAEEGLENHEDTIENEAEPSLPGISRLQHRLNGVVRPTVPQMFKFCSRLLIDSLAKLAHSGTFQSGWFGLPWHPFATETDDHGAVAFALERYLQSEGFLTAGVEWAVHGAYDVHSVDWSDAMVARAERAIESLAEEGLQADVDLLKVYNARAKHAINSEGMAIMAELKDEILTAARASSSTCSASINRKEMIDALELRVDSKDVIQALESGLQHLGFQGVRIAALDNSLYFFQNIDWSKSRDTDSAFIKELRLTSKHMRELETTRAFSYIEEQIRKRASLGFQKWHGAVPCDIVASYKNDAYRIAVAMDLTGALRRMGFKNALVKWTKFYIDARNPDTQEDREFEQEQFLVEHLDWSHGACEHEDPEKCKYVKSLWHIAHLSRKPLVFGLLNRVISTVEQAVDSDKREVTARLFGLVRNRKYDHQSIAEDLQEELSSVGFADVKVVFDDRFLMFYVSGLSWALEDMETIKANMPGSQYVMDLWARAHVAPRQVVDDLIQQISRAILQLMENNEGVELPGGVQSITFLIDAPNTHQTRIRHVLETALRAIGFIGTRVYYDPKQGDHGKYHIYGVRWGPNRPSSTLERQLTNAARFSDAAEGATRRARGGLYMQILRGADAADNPDIQILGDAASQEEGEMQIVNVVEESAASSQSRADSRPAILRVQPGMQRWPGSLALDRVLEDDTENDQISQDRDNANRDRDNTNRENNAEEIDTATGLRPHTGAAETDGFDPFSRSPYRTGLRYGPPMTREALRTTIAAASDLSSVTNDASTRASTNEEGSAPRSPRDARFTQAEVDFLARAARRQSARSQVNEDDARISTINEGEEDFLARLARHGSSLTPEQVNRAINAWLDRHDRSGVRTSLPDDGAQAALDEFLGVDNGSGSQRPLSPERSYDPSRYQSEQRPLSPEGPPANQAYDPSRYQADPIPVDGIQDALHSSDRSEFTPAAQAALARRTDQTPSDDYETESDTGLDEASSLGDTRASEAFNSRDRRAQAEQRPIVSREAVSFLESENEDGAPSEASTEDHSHVARSRRTPDRDENGELVGGRYFVAADDRQEIEVRDGHVRDPRVPIRNPRERYGPYTTDRLQPSDAEAVEAYIQQLLDSSLTGPAREQVLEQVLGPRRRSYIEQVTPGLGPSRRDAVRSHLADADVRDALGLPSPSSPGEVSAGDVSAGALTATTISESSPDADSLRGDSRFLPRFTPSNMVLRGLQRDLENDSSEYLRRNSEDIRELLRQTGLSLSTTGLTDISSIPSVPSEDYRSSGELSMDDARLDDIVDGVTRETVDAAIAQFLADLDASRVPRARVLDARIVDPTEEMDEDSGEGSQDHEDEDEDAMSRSDEESSSAASTPRTDTPQSNSSDAFRSYQGMELARDRRARHLSSRIGRIGDIRHNPRYQVRYNHRTHSYEHAHADVSEGDEDASTEDGGSERYDSAQESAEDSEEGSRASDGLDDGRLEDGHESDGREAVGRDAGEEGDRFSERFQNEYDAEYWEEKYAESVRDSQSAADAILNADGERNSDLSERDPSDEGGEEFEQLSSDLLADSHRSEGELSPGEVFASAEGGTEEEVSAARREAERGYRHWESRVERLADRQRQVAAARRRMAEVAAAGRRLAEASAQDSISARDAMRAYRDLQTQLSQEMRNFFQITEDSRQASAELGQEQRDEEGARARQRIEDAANQAAAALDAAEQLVDSWPNLATGELALSDAASPISRSDGDNTSGGDHTPRRHSDSDLETNPHLQYPEAGAPPSTLESPPPPPDSPPATPPSSPWRSFTPAYTDV